MWAILVSGRRFDDGYYDDALFPATMTALAVPSFSFSPPPHPQDIHENLHATASTNRDNLVFYIFLLFFFFFVNSNFTFSCATRGDECR